MLFRRSPAPVTMATLPSRRYWSSEKVIANSCFRKSDSASRDQVEERLGHVAHRCKIGIIAHQLPKQPKILVQQRAAMFEGRKVAHHAGIDFEAHAAATALLDELDERVGIKTKLGARFHGMARNRHVGRQQSVVDELGMLPCPYIAEQDDQLAEGFEYGARGRQAVLVASDHQGQRAGLRCWRAAAHRGIDEFDAMRLRL